MCHSFIHIYFSIGVRGALIYQVPYLLSTTYHRIALGLGVSHWDPGNGDGEERLIT